MFRLRDERRFANRRVDVDAGRTFCWRRCWSRTWPAAAVSSTASSRPPSPIRRHLPSIKELLQGYEENVPHFVNALQPIEWRYTNDPSWVMRDKGDQLDHNRVWVKADGVLPDDPVLHTATMLYCSDTTVLDSIITTHGLSWGFDRIFAATVNHSVWFHRPSGFQRLGAVLHVLAGRGGFPWAGHRLLLRQRSGDRWPPWCKRVW